MKVKNLKIRLGTAKESLDQFVKTGTNLAKKKKRKKKSENEFIITFPDLQIFAKIFSAERIRLLRIVRHETPSSIKELAALLNRDYPNVHADVTFLANQGFLELESKPGRGKGTMVPKFDWDGFEIAV